MKTHLFDFRRIPLVLTAVLSVVCGAYAEQAPNPRGGTVVSSSTATDTTSGAATARSTSSRVVRTNLSATDSGLTVTGRSAANSVSRSATARPSVTVARTASVQPATSNVVTGRSGTVLQMAPTTGMNASRSATTARTASSNVISGASHSTASTARAASSNSVVGLSRAATARATAVFSDISAIGGGYAKCREAYATCMDQFCANANDTYRRCICSARYDEFRNTENAIDQALNLLAQFEDNNLNAVGLSAEEVAAMYSATEGEMAIKNDTSAAANMLAEISDLLSGKSSSTSSSGTSGTSLGLLTVDFTSDLGDIWGEGSSSSSIFSTSSGVDLASLTGQDLFNEASKQCLELVADSCENNATLTMARSAYSIMITQDCNLYEKNINSQKESLEQTVRTAEKYLREARLEEYQSHNSADVNECIASVRNAIQSDAACGANYSRCLDYTGAYINQSTGEAIYSPRLFQLADLITLPGVNASDATDVLGANPEFNSFLDSRRMFAETALDSCRDMADIVWEEFKRQALIEIAQAQDEKIEEVKMSCVSTMAECYDTQTGALQDFDNTTSQYTGVISAYAARAMCEDKVIACASLYGDTEGCEFDGNGQLKTGNASGGLTGAAANSRCGLTALLAFVDTVDTVRVAEGCETAITNYLKDLCTPTSGDKGYPWNCRNMTVSDLRTSINEFAQQNCSDPTNSGAGFLAQVQDQIDRALSDVEENIDYLLMESCENLDGYWLDYDDTFTNIADTRVNGNGILLSGFYKDVYGGNENTSWGRCVENTTMIQCLRYNEGLDTAVASYDLTRDECDFTEEWYRQRCEELMGGYYEGSACYVAK